MFTYIVGIEFIQIKKAIDSGNYMFHVGLSIYFLYYQLKEYLKVSDLIIGNEMLKDSYETLS